MLLFQDASKRHETQIIFFYIYSQKSWHVRQLEIHGFDNGGGKSGKVGL